MNGVSTIDNIKKLLSTNEVVDKKLAIYEVANLCGNYRTDMLLELYVEGKDIIITRTLQSIFRKISLENWNYNELISRGSSIVSDYFGVIVNMETNYGYNGVKWNKDMIIVRLAEKLYELFDVESGSYNHDRKFVEIMTKQYRHKNEHKRLMYTYDIFGIVVDVFWK